MNNNLIVICGPTASGKTRLGVAIARAYGGEIISCDSRQVYRGMDIGTGKDLTEYSHGGTGVPYHLIDIVDPAEVYTVRRYQRDFYRVFDEIRARQKLPVVVGGSGLYLEAVLRGYAIPEVPENPALRAALMQKEKSALEEELARLDLVRYRATDLSSKKRIVRSLEIAYSQEKHYSPEPDITGPELRPLVIGVVWERARLHERIKERLRARFEQGMVDEVKRLLDAGIPESRFAMFGLEYKHIARYIRGEVDFEDMFAELFQAIRHFAKRQETYFRGMERRGIKIAWVKDGDVGTAMNILARHRP
jgi:tRNA dimethylallyltransferase